jgi:hypothetical protein
MVKRLWTWAALVKTVTSIPARLQLVKEALDRGQIGR